MAKDLNINEKLRPTGTAANETAETLEKGGRKQQQQGEASEAEKLQRMDNFKTQGRKGCEAKRINMAFTPDNYNFIRVVSSSTATTMTKLTNLIIEQYRSEHPELLEQSYKTRELSGLFQNTKTD